MTEQGSRQRVTSPHLERAHRALRRRAAVSPTYPGGSSFAATPRATARSSSSAGRRRARRRARRLGAHRRHRPTRWPSSNCCGPKGSTASPSTCSSPTRATGAAVPRTRRRSTARAPIRCARMPSSRPRSARIRFARIRSARMRRRRAARARASGRVFPERTLAGSGLRRSSFWTRAWPAARRTAQVNADDQRPALLASAGAPGRISGSRGASGRPDPVRRPGR